ncbi:hypothetical protein [Pseudomonas chlororaphis]|nr:hypothetical protein [Pseudomonas chlororaphis]
MIALAWFAYVYCYKGCGGDGGCQWLADHHTEDEGAESRLE